MTNAMMIAAAHSLGRRLARAAKAAAHGALFAATLLLTFVPSVLALFLAPLLLFGTFGFLELLSRSGAMPPLALRAPFDHLGHPFAWWLLAMAGAEAALAAWAASSGTRAELASQGMGPLQATLASPMSFIGSRLKQLEAARSSGSATALLRGGARTAAPFALGCLAFPLIAAIRALSIAKERLPTEAPTLASAKKSWGAAFTRLAQESPEVLARLEAKALGAHASDPANSEHRPPRL